MTRLIHCDECGRNKPHWAKGLCVACYMRQWRRDNPDKSREQSRRYRRAHPDRAHEAGRRYRRANPDKMCKKAQRWREANREKTRGASRRWAKANPKKRCKNERRRRARKNGAAIGQVNEAAIYELYNNTCIYCGSKENLTLDHIVPLVGGGPHCEDNLVVACRSCNSGKRDKLLEEWLQTQPKALALVM